MITIIRIARGRKAEQWQASQEQYGCSNPLISLRFWAVAEEKIRMLAIQIMDCGGK